MSTVLFLELLFAAVLVSYFVLGVRAWRRYRGTRIVTCPETLAPAAVEVDETHAAVTALRGDRPDVRLKSCSRWPERQDCGQECLKDLELDPESCLAKNMLARWYVNKVCVLCHEPIAGIDPIHPKPGLFSPDGRAVSWEALPLNQLPTILETYSPLCSNCLIVETFRHQYPELPIDDRPARDAAGVLHLGNAKR